MLSHRRLLYIDYLNYIDYIRIFPNISLESNNDDWDLVSKFIEYGYSDAGMDHVMDVGYVALPQAMIDEMVARIG